MASFKLLFVKLRDFFRNQKLVYTQYQRRNLVSSSDDGSFHSYWFGAHLFFAAMLGHTKIAKSISMESLKLKHRIFCIQTVIFRQASRTIQKSVSEKLNHNLFSARE